MGIFNTKVALLGVAILFACASSVFAFAVYGAIGAKYAALGREAGPLGAPMSDEADAPGGGRFNNFRNGAIYWHPTIGAFAVWGAIEDKWTSLGRVGYGYPITDETVTPDRRGRFNHFRQINLPGRPESSIYWTPQTGAHAVYGAIRQKWASMGWERGALGYPISDEYQDGQYRRSDFEGGSIRWTAQGGAVTIPKARAGCTIYEHRDYGGASLRFGDFDRIRMVNGESVGCTTNGHSAGCESILYKPSWNDKVSSFQVGGGCTITLWKHINSGEPHFRSNRSYSYVGGAWNDQASEALCSCQ
ncbi:hypothetical protein [Jiella pacifica]|uniref:LGFP repeat-containing protein n=1 Tax=Jiella pacifica TaxID=2696469 RepID=A0A6N9T393_9HYPH|nr:hypothetical protein [Jiella pacifica]NDW04309.1 hypothetical protein [Jiella pacifica]